MEKKKGKKDVSILMTPLCALLIIGYPLCVSHRRSCIVHSQQLLQRTSLQGYTDGYINYPSVETSSHP